ncbi:MAG: nitrilase-related carbon-nitrogen hydrolase, partial [Atopobiaceae bacterium]|nr:nitrilase-related carbon-nitrogen hydrolase [Atopobiaceae bacterium]
MIVAIAQMNTHAGDFGMTVDRMATLSKRAADQEAKLIVFPAPCLTGQAVQDFPSREGFQADLLQALDRLSRELSCPAIVPILAEQDGESYREVMLLKDGEVSALRMGAYEAEAQGNRATQEDSLFT